MSRLDPTHIPSGPDRRPLILGIIAGVVALALSAAAFFVFFKPAAPTQTGPVAIKPADAAKGFLEAVAAGRAADALSYATVTPADTSWLTDEVLAASAKNTPLVVVSVADVTGESKALVGATVTWGGKSSTLDLPVSKTANGWRVDQVTSELNLALIPQSLPVTINGIDAPATSSVQVFPGGYVLASGMEEIALTATPHLVDSVGQTYELPLDAKLTKAGRSTVLALARAHVETCLTKKSLTPSGCPNAVVPAKGQTVQEKTVRWTVEGNPWDKVKYSINNAQPTLVQGTGTFNFRLRCSLKQDGLSYQVDQKIPYTLLFETDLGAPDSKVTWTRS